MTDVKYNVLESIRHGITLIEYWDNGIIYFQIDAHSEIQLEDSKFHNQYLRSKFNGKDKLKILTNPGKYTTISKEAREYATLPQSNEMTLASAVVIKSPAQRLLVNFIINFTQKQALKMKVFATKEEATEWLLSL